MTRPRMQTLVARLYAADAAVEKVDAGGPDDAMDQAMDALDASVTALCRRPAKTPAELAAKARALMVALRRDIPCYVDETFDSAAEPHDLLAMSLARDAIALAERGAS